MFGICRGLPMIKIAHNRFEVTGNTPNLGNAKFVINDLEILPKITQSLGKNTFMLAECPTLELSGITLHGYFPISNETTAVMKITYCKNTAFSQISTEMLDLWNRLIFATEDIPADSDYIVYKKQVQS